MTPHQIKESDISTSSENYLEVIYELSQKGNSVKSVEVAKRMDVSKASVNKAIGVLRNAGMVEQQLYGSIMLTEQGVERAKEVAYRHQTIKKFLINILGVDETTADEDACRMEHVVSEKTMKLWTRYLDNKL